MASITWGYRGTHNPTTMTHVLLGTSAHKEVSILDIWHPIVSIWIVVTGQAQLIWACLIQGSTQFEFFAWFLRFHVYVTPNLSPPHSFVSKNALVQLTVDLISSIKTSVWIKMTKEQHVKLENITSWLDRDILKNGLLHQVVCL